MSQSKSCSDSTNPIGKLANTPAGSGSAAQIFKLLYYDQIDYFIIQSDQSNQLETVYPVPKLAKTPTRD